MSRPLVEPPIPRSRYAELVRAMAGRSLLVVGDLMLDEYLHGRATRVSPESPVLVVNVERDEWKPGGAANVAHNLLALSGRAAVVGAVGDDSCGRRLRSLLAAAGADVTGIVTLPGRPTTRKTRIVAHNQQVLRVDRERSTPVEAAARERLLEHVAAALPRVEAVLVSDYRKGVLTPEMATRLMCLAAEAGRPVIANPKPASARWLAGARVLSLNQVEAEELAGAPLPAAEEQLARFGDRLLAELDTETLVITRGSRGLTYWNRGVGHHTVPAHAVEVFDVAGAGDTTITALAVALAAGATIHEAACVANHAGACVVRKRGVAVTGLEELLRDCAADEE
jgi:rfaE bifunctional protein kinase chain/domain